MQDKKLVQEYVIFVLRHICRARLIAAATVFTVFTVNTNVTYRVWLATWLLTRGGIDWQVYLSKQQGYKVRFLGPLRDGDTLEQQASLERIDLELLDLALTAELGHGGCTEAVGRREAVLLGLGAHLLVGVGPLPSFTSLPA